jgi:hypothetical protein
LFSYVSAEVSRTELLVSIITYAKVRNLKKKRISYGTRNWCYYGEILKEEEEQETGCKRPLKKITGTVIKKNCNLRINVHLNFDRYLPLSLFVYCPLDRCNFCLWSVWAKRSTFDFEESVFRIVLENILYADITVHFLLNMLLFWMKI